MAMADQQDNRAVRDATNDVIDRVIGFDDETRRRIFRTALTFYGYGAEAAFASRTVGQVALPSAPTHERQPRSIEHAPFSDRTELPPKDFLFQKQPITDVERIACLAYYLTHYRDTRHFKTIDISKLNTEAAQIKFSNTAYAVVNAVNAGLLASAGKGFKQLSAIGERYVEALPDRNAAKEVFATLRNRRAHRANKNHKEPQAPVQSR
jgi:restriction endonuclease Mrr